MSTRRLMRNVEPGKVYDIKVYGSYVEKNEGDYKWTERDFPGSIAYHSIVTESEANNLYNAAKAIGKVHYTAYVFDGDKIIAGNGFNSIEDILNGLFNTAYAEWTSDGIWFGYGMPNPDENNGFAYFGTHNGEGWHSGAYIIEWEEFRCVKLDHIYRNVRIDDDKFFYDQGQA